MPCASGRPTAGIICEYDPFHRGHARQFELIRRELPDARIVCVMSGCFTQRGAPALFSPAQRARAALEAGADAVLELPCAFAVRDAERFARGGVELLNALGCVTNISFGAESGIDVLMPAAKLLEAPDERFNAELKRGLQDGLSHAAARGKALAACLPETAAALEKPNNILAVCYLRALIRSGSRIKPLPVIREGEYHDETLPEKSGFPSATAVRAAYLRGDFAAAESACGYGLPRGLTVEKRAENAVCPPDALDRLLLYKLRTSDPKALEALPDCAEGLHNRLTACAREASSREELLAVLKTKRYTYSRLSRLCCHALLGVTRGLTDAHPSPEYARLLGFRTESAELLSELKHGDIPILSRGTDGDNDSPLVRLDERAYELWALGAGIPAGLWYRQKMVKV